MRNSGDLEPVFLWSRLRNLSRFLGRNFREYGEMPKKQLQDQLHLLGSSTVLGTGLRSMIAFMHPGPLNMCHH